MLANNLTGSESSGPDPAVIRSFYTDVWRQRGEDPKTETALKQHVAIKLTGLGLETNIQAPVDTLLRQWFDTVTQDPRSPIRAKWLAYEQAITQRPRDLVRGVFGTTATALGWNEAVPGGQRNSVDAATGTTLQGGGGTVTSVKRISDRDMREWCQGVTGHCPSEHCSRTSRCDDTVCPIHMPDKFQLPRKWVGVPEDVEFLGEEVEQDEFL
jgi:hypothetical protein